MIFQHTHEWVMNGTKTQTRRIIRPGERYETRAQQVVAANGRRVYEVGMDYAVQPGRGKKSIGRIKITGIRSQDVRDISHADAQAEGGFDVQSYLCLWAQMYDKALDAHYHEQMDAYGFKTPHTAMGYIYVSPEHTDDIVGMYRERPDERYQAWGIEFELVEVTP